MGIPFPCLGLVSLDKEIKLDSGGTGRRIRSSGCPWLLGETGHPGLDADKPRALDK